MKTIYHWGKRQALKNQMKAMAILITHLKDDRKTIRPKKFPNFIRPCGVWLDTEKHHFRHHHIAASLMRGRTIEQIERLPNSIYDRARRGRPDMKVVNSIMEDCKREYVHSSAEESIEVATGSSSGPCIS